MALVNRRECDVYGTTRDVRHFRLRLAAIDQGGIEDPEFSVTEKLVDLSPRGLKRLIHMIDVGTTPAAKRQRSVTEAEE